MYLVLIALAGAVQTAAMAPTAAAAPASSIPHVPPRLLNGAPPVTARDYPAKARREGLEGSVTVSLSIGVKGRVTSCRIIRSSASAILDEAACRLWWKHARFEPARDAEGAAVVSFAQATIDFALADPPGDSGHPKKIDQSASQLTRSPGAN